MEFLKSILGDDLYKQVSEKVATYNESNKDKQIKIANLGEGNYVGKEKYTSLETELNSKLAELKSANDLINGMKKETKGNEELQAKITDYESKITALNQQLQATKLESAIKVALLEAKASDIDYMTFKLKEKGELALDENGKIKGIEDKISGLKTQFPNQFEGSSEKKIIENKLPDNKDHSAYTKEELLKKPYAERVALFEENPEAFKTAMKN